VGQEITIAASVGASDDVRVFDTNRSLTGMEIERYHAADDAVGNRPPDVLARRLFDLGATSVTVYSNVVTVEAPAGEWSDLEPKVMETIEHLFGFYGSDAGWSDDALRALGVEPYPRPEPAK